MIIMMAGSEPSSAGSQTLSAFSRVEMCIFRLKYTGRMTPDMSAMGRKIDQAMPTKPWLKTFTEMTDAETQSNAVRAVRTAKTLC